MDATHVGPGTGFSRRSGGWPAKIATLMTQRIWVPRFLYAVIPWLYLCGGGSCLVAAVHLPDHQWVVPYALFLGMAGLHSGLLVLSFRRRVNRDAARNG